MIKRLRIYIAHCSQCQVNQTKRHRFYDELQSIVSLAISFHIVFMNFVIALSSSRNYNVLLIVTCKFTKKILLLLEIDTWDVVKWVDAMIVALIDYDWEVSKIIIFDRNSKFMLEFWKIVFIKSKTIMLTSIAYHSQIDDQSKRTNQIIEIVLRYHLIATLDDEWIDILSFL